MDKPRVYIVGNWKMHGNAATARQLAASVAAGFKASQHIEVVLCPPAMLMGEVKAVVTGSSLKMGGQDCHGEKEGAYTGDISAAMLKEAGCSYVITGHSERRMFHKETSADVSKKAAQAMAAGLVPIICIGETEAERDAGKALDVVKKQVEESLPKEASRGDFLLAYEPVWAIGSGKTPTSADIRQMHAQILAVAAKQTGLPQGRIPVLYGGSVKAANAPEILATEGVAGALVGGASLKADEFGRIIAAAVELKKG